MKIFTGRLMQALEVELYNLSLQKLNEYERLKVAIKLCKKALAILKKFISCYFFESIDEEIMFFKQIKSLFYSKYIYYLSVYQFTIKKPTGSEEVLKNYLDSQLLDLKRFFDQNQAFICITDRTTLISTVCTSLEAGLTSIQTWRTSRRMSCFLPAMTISSLKFLPTRSFMSFFICSRNMQTMR